MGAPALQHRLHNLLGHGLRIQRFAREALEERGACVSLAHEDGAHLGGIVLCEQLERKTLMEGNGGRFGGSIVDHGGRAEVAGQRGDGDDHAVVALNHGGEELLGEEVMREGIHVEGEADVVLAGLEDGFATSTAGIVDKDGGIAEGGTDGGCGGYNGGLGGEIALEVLHRGRGWEALVR